MGRQPAGKQVRKPVDNIQAVKLTADELELMKQVALGQSDQEISVMLGGLAPMAVQARVHRLCVKLGVRNRAHLAATYIANFNAEFGKSALTTQEIQQVVERTVKECGMTEAMLGKLAERLSGRIKV